VPNEVSKFSPADRLGTGTLLRQFPTSGLPELSFLGPPRLLTRLSTAFLTLRSLPSPVPARVGISLCCSPNQRLSRRRRTHVTLSLRGLFFAQPIHGRHWTSDRQHSPFSARSWLIHLSASDASARLGPSGLRRCHLMRWDGVAPADAAISERALGMHRPLPGSAQSCPAGCRVSLNQMP
jgi:hypothetical protein